MKHVSIAFDLIYVSMHQYNDDDERVYIEMKNENWWWKKQFNLFENIIVILLLIIIDKTMMIQHHNNVTIWFVYMLIENLNVKTRRQQNRLDNLIFDFISIEVIFDQSDIKIKIWHKTLFFMLERQFIFQRNANTRLISIFVND